MANIAVEDCLIDNDNRFELTLRAAKRARQISMGATPLVDMAGNKTTVVALREIAAELLTDEILENNGVAAADVDSDVDSEVDEDEQQEVAVETVEDTSAA